MKFKALWIAGLMLAVVAPASTNAGMVINVTEVGSDVVFTATGTLNLAGATSAGSYPSYSLGFISAGSNWYVGPGGGGNTVGYEMTSFAGDFGTSATFVTPPDSSSGDDFFIWGQGGLTEQVGVDASYISGNAISSGMVFNNATIAGLNMTAGTYNYTIPSDFITLVIGAASAVPEPASIAMWGFGALGLMFAARKRRKMLMAA